MTGPIPTAETTVGTVFGNRTSTTDNKVVKAQIRVIGLTVIPFVWNYKSRRAAIEPVTQSCRPPELTKTPMLAALMWLGG